MTISRRLALASAVAVAIAIAIASVGAYLAVRSKLRGEVDSSLRDRALAAQQIAPGGPAPQAPPRGPGNQSPFGPVPVPDSVAARFGGATGVIQFITPQGRAIAGPEGGPRLPVSPASRGIAAGGGGTEVSDETVAGDHLRVLTAPLPNGGAIQVARPLNEVDSVLSDLVVILAGITVAGVALAAVLGGAVSRASLAPVRRFTEQTEDVAGEGDLSRRLPDGGEDELGRLARTYNSTLDGLEASVDAQRRLVSDASHELRTPLATVKTNLEVMLRDPEMSDQQRSEISADLVAQVDELTLLVEDVVELARRGEREPLSEEVALEQVVKRATAAARFQGTGVEFHSELEPFTLHGDPERLAKAVTNLLDNAVKWSPPGGAVQVDLHGGQLVVRDHGPGIPPQDLPFIFDRFHRADGARKTRGSGLGLAIVRQVAEAHGAAVRAENAEGGGARLQISFPAG